MGGGTRRCLPAGARRGRPRRRRARPRVSAVRAGFWPVLEQLSGGGETWLPDRRAPRGILEHVCAFAQRRAAPAVRQSAAEGVTARDFSISTLEGGGYGLPVIGHCNYSAVIKAVITCNYTSPFSVTCNLSPAPLCPPSAVRPCVSPCLCAFVSMAALRNHKGELITDANEQQIKVWARR